MKIFRVSESKSTKVFQGIKQSYWLTFSPSLGPRALIFQHSVSDFSAGPKVWTRTCSIYVHICLDAIAILAFQWRNIVASNYFNEVEDHN